MLYSLYDYPSESSMEPWKQGLVVPKAALMSLLVTGRDRQICVKVLSLDD
jgi:hypothetical protein